MSVGGDNALVANVQENPFVKKNSSKRIYVEENQIKIPVVTTKNPFIFDYLSGACVCMVVLFWNF